MKQCTKCRNEYPTTAEFFSSKSGGSKYFRSWCKKCIAKDSRKYRERNRKLLSERARAYSQTPKGMLSRYKCQMKLKYKLEVEDIVKMYDNQRGCCAICKQSLISPDSKELPHIDHDHTTGVVRGVLCATCNKGIGHLQDDADLCIRASTYLLAGGFNA